MKEPAWVLRDIAIAAHQMLIAEHGGLSGIRDETLLDSALTRPQQRFAYDDNFSLFKFAASYSYGLSTNHPFVDGNKRVALTVAAIFLKLNGYHLDASEAEAVVIFEKLAAGNLSEDDLATWFKDSFNLGS